MEHFGITEIELWDYISKNANTYTICKVKAWMDSSDFDECVFCQLSKLHKLTTEVEVTYDFDTVEERFLQAIKTNNITNWVDSDKSKFA